MHCIHLKNQDPFYCLAAEEHLLKNYNDDIFMLWQSSNSVVVGKHQNLLAEINYPYVREKNITVARRISGGGTVVHDSGNVNFTFIKNVKSPAEVSFKLFTEPIVEALELLGIKATTSGRNDLLIKGMKISGNAEHIFKNRVLHHGTLLFNSDLENLGKAIEVIPGKYESKAVQSNRSPVENISTFLKSKMNTDEFIDFLLNVQLQKQGNKRYTLGNKDESIIGKQAVEKFRTWKWRYGYSPKYVFSNEVQRDGKLIRIVLEVKKGIIENCGIGGDYFSMMEAGYISRGLMGRRHFFEDILSADGIDEDLVSAFF